MPISNFAFLFAVTLLLTVLSAVIAHRRKRVRRLRQEQGIKWLSCLRSLLSHIQRHRGLTMGFLNGDKSLTRDIEKLQQEVNRDITAVIHIDSAIEENLRWQGIAEHWVRLSNNCLDLETENNLTQHNMLIKNILYLIDDLAQACDLLQLRSSVNRPLHIYWRELLAAAEFIGQARAIGTGVAAAGICDSVSRIRLNYLKQKIETNARQLWQEIGRQEDQETKIYSLLQCMSSQLILDKPGISSAGFFNMATEALDTLLDHFDRLIRDL